MRIHTQQIDIRIHDKIHCCTRWFRQMLFEFRSWMSWSCFKLMHGTPGGIGVFLQYNSHFDWKSMLTGNDDESKTHTSRSLHRRRRSCIVDYAVSLNIKWSLTVIKTKWMSSISWGSRCIHARTLDANWNPYSPYKSYKYYFSFSYLLPHRGMSQDLSLYNFEVVITLNVLEFYFVGPFCSFFDGD